jgi:hypothetical protein
LNFRDLNTLRGDAIYVYYGLCDLFYFPSKVGSAHGWNKGIVHRSKEASSAGQMNSNKRKGQGKGGVCRNDSRRAPSSVRGRGRGQNSAKAKANRVLLDSEVGGSGDLLPIVKMSFQDGRYSPLTRMEMIEWQIILEQFIAMGLILNEEVVNIDSE